MRRKPHQNPQQESNPKREKTYIFESVQNAHFDLDGFGGGSFVVTHGCFALLSFA